MGGEVGISSFAKKLSKTIINVSTFKLRLDKYGVPNGIRTHVAAVKGRCPRPLDDGDRF